MPTFLHDNRMLAWSLAAVAFLVAFLLILKIVEIAADLRRRLPRGSKSRQLRLGFVESYDLDGERRLMLVRRDNVEHLLMIGGPNDLLVEAGIMRVEPREARPPRSAETLAGGAPPPAPAPHHAPSAAERPAAPLQPPSGRSAALPWRRRPLAPPAAPHPLAPHPLAPPAAPHPLRRPPRRSLRLLRRRASWPRRPPLLIAAARAASAPRRRARAFRDRSTAAGAAFPASAPRRTGQAGFHAAATLHAAGRPRRRPAAKTAFRRADLRPPRDDAAHGAAGRPAARSGDAAPQVR